MACVPDMAKEGELRIGPAGWSYTDWAGKVYPLRRPRGFSELGFIASLFNTVEVNTSFYRPVAPALAAGWLRKVPPDFLFSVKLWQRFTHESAPPADVAAAVKTFRAGIDPLLRTGKLGALLAQFPWSFRDTQENRDRIRRVRESFADVPVVVEVRHAEWNAPDALRFFESLGVSFCNIDQPPSRSSLPPTGHVTASVAYVRLHGRNSQAWFDPQAGRDDRYDYLYSAKELDGWVSIIRSLLRRAERVFVVANNHYQGKAVANALQLKAALTGRPVDPPETLVAAYPGLAAIPGGSRDGCGGPQPLLFPGAERTL